MFGRILVIIYLIGLFYYILGTNIYWLKLKKKRGEDAVKRLTHLIFLLSYTVSIFIVIYFGYISTALCFLYAILFLLMVFAFILLYREDAKEDFINNLALVIDETRDVESLTARDLLIPDHTFTAKMIHRYGPKIAARLHLILGIFLLVLLFSSFYLFLNDTMFWIIYTLICLPIFVIDYNKKVGKYETALLRAGAGSYKKEYELLTSTSS